ncbi:MAG: hypothetical protein EOO38_02760 [Cytophagaceae bacterium]|nr:MAG: hypothetical protein EOO38_02760 [Cytophagaceae bacterium]
MNIFYLSDNLEECAEFHIDRHVTKMILESAQLLCMALWSDKLFGYTPRALTPEEYAELKTVMRAEPANMDERTFVPYKAGHHNHPCSIWLRESAEHFYYLHNLANELQREAWYRGYNTHKSIGVINSLPLPQSTPDHGFKPPYQAMPPELKTDDVLQDYRLFYMLDKAAIPATWRGRDKPFWWDEDIALYHKRYTAMTIPERKEIGFL